jgi:hypothetical protein
MMHDGCSRKFRVWFLLLEIQDANISCKLKHPCMYLPALEVQKHHTIRVQIHTQLFKLLSHIDLGLFSSPGSLYI